MTDNNTTNDINLSSYISSELPKLLSAALASPKSRDALMQLVPRLIAEYDWHHNWNNIDFNTNGERWFVEKVVPRSKCVIDIGANIGEWSQLCLSVNNLVEIYSFEANPATAHVLANQFHAVNNVHVFPYGLGEKDTILEFHDHGAGSGLSSFVSRMGTAGLSPQRTLQIPCKRIVDIEELASIDAIDLIKIDTEGFEMPILRSMAPWLSERRIRLVQFEYGGTWIDAHEFLADAVALFHEYGYKVGRLMPQSIVWLGDFDHRHYENFKYSNFVACSSQNDLSEYQLENA